MKKWIRTLPGLVLLAAGLLLPSPGQGEQASAEGYHTYRALTQALKQIASAHPNITQLVSLGKTLQGRDIWLLQVTGTKGPSPREKQALLICGNLEGDHLVGSEVALGIARYLAQNYGKDETVTRTLDSRTFVIIPRLNPDGAEYFFHNPLVEHPANTRPRDEDYDWLIDEDPPEDINGDGMITWMRVKDKQGEWVIDDKDPRLMKKKKAGTPVEKLYSLYPEGYDDDGDGLYNEDPVGGFNINRNFPHNFGYRPKGLGVYPASETETKAVIDFMTRYSPELKTQPHRNICGVLLFSKFDNLAATAGIECGTPTFPEPPRAEAAPTITRMFFFMGRRRGAPAQPESRPTDPQPKKTDSRDTYLFENISKAYKEITGIKSAHSEKPAGSMLEWAYFQYGVPAFSANLWSLREEEQKAPAPQRKKEAQSATTQARAADRMAMFRQFMGRRTPSASAATSSTQDEKWLKWIDEKNNGKGFLPWTPFRHRQLGDVEIGGFEPYLKVNPPAEKIPELVESHARFALHLASQFATIEMGEPEVNRLSDNLFELKVKVHNRGHFPYATAMGQRTRNINAILVRASLEDEKSMKFFGSTRRVDIPTLDPGAEKEIRWLILSPSGKNVELTLWARNGGGTSRKFVVLR